MYLIVAIPTMILTYVILNIVGKTTLIVVLLFFFRSQICIDSYILSGINDYSDSYIYIYNLGRW